MIKKYIKLFTASVLCGLFLLTLVNALPIAPMQKNVLSHVWNDNYLKDVIPYYEGTNLATWTDHLMLAIAITDEPGDNPIEESLISYQPHYEGNYVPELILKEMANGNPDVINTSYGRYWHGYLVYLKPLLLFCNYFDIQIFNTLLCFSALLLVTYKIYNDKKLKKYSLRFFISYLFICPFIIGISLQFSSVFYISLLGAYLITRLDKKDSSYLIFSFIGILTCFMDFLTYPMITLCVPLTLYCLKYKDEISIKDVIVQSIFWGMSYTLFWASKWILTSLFTEYNIIKDTIDQIFLRSGTNIDGAKVNRIDALSSTFDILTNKAYLLFLILCLTVYVSNALKFKNLIFLPSKTVIALIAISIIPLIWLVVTANHAIFHAFFTYRNLIGFIFPLICLVPTIDTTNNH